MTGPRFIGFKLIAQHLALPTFKTRRSRSLLQAADTFIHVLRRGRLESDSSTFKSDRLGLRYLVRKSAASPPVGDLSD